MVDGWRLPVRRGGTAYRNAGAGREFPAMRGVAAR